MKDLQRKEVGISRGAPLRTFPGPWDGQILLACGKCQRKLRKHEDPARLGKLKKLLKHAQPRLYVINTVCLDVCPKRGVTVCSAAQVARGEFSILRTTEDVARLLASTG